MRNVYVAGKRPGTDWFLAWNFSKNYSWRSPNQKVGAKNRLMYLKRPSKSGRKLGSFLKVNQVALEVPNCFGMIFLLWFFILFPCWRSLTIQEKCENFFNLFSWTVFFSPLSFL